MDVEFDLTFWIKFGVCFGLFVIVPVWVFNMVEISFLWKVMFTLAGAGGVVIALQGKTMRLHK